MCKIHILILIIQIYEVVISLLRLLYIVYEVFFQHIKGEKNLDL